jgi:CheY-like chemotaxis protein
MEGVAKRILVIDDVAFIVNAIQRAFVGRYQVERASAAEALQRIQGGERFDAILCDIVMPGLSGEGLYRELARVAPGQAARILFMTAAPLEDPRCDFLRALPNLRFEKPFGVSELKELLARFLETSAEIDPPR